jgi:hypothetical protein
VSARTATPHARRTDSRSRVPARHLVDSHAARPRGHARRGPRARGGRTTGRGPRARSRDETRRPRPPPVATNHHGLCAPLPTVYTYGNVHHSPSVTPWVTRHPRWGAAVITHRRGYAGAPTQCATRGRVTAPSCASSVRALRRQKVATAVGRGHHRHRVAARRGVQ